MSGFRRVLHIVNLEGRGGMEHLFLGYLGTTLHAAQGRVALAVKDDIAAVHCNRLVRSTAPKYNLKRLGRIRLAPVPGLRDWNMARILARARPDRVVLWSTLPRSAWTAACARQGVETIYYEHGKGWLVDRAAASRALVGVDRALSVSAAGRRMLQERLGFDGPVTVVPNGLRFETEEAVERASVRAPLRIGFAGRLVDNKGVAILLEAARILRARGIAFELRIAGSGPQEPALRALATRADLDDRVAFLGSVADMASFYRSIDTVVAPSICEAFGLTSIEAAAFGAVPLVARVDGLAETVRDGETGFSLPVTGSLEAYRRLGGDGTNLPELVYDPDTDRLRQPGIVEPEALADVLASLARRPGKLAHMSVEAVNWAREGFAHARFVERLDQVLHGNCVGRTPPDGGKAAP